jgi:hypothetical protein
MQALLQQRPGLIYAHSKDGENIWHAAAQGGHPEVCQGYAWQPIADTYGSAMGWHFCGSEVMNHVDTWFNGSAQGGHLDVSHSV